MTDLGRLLLPSGKRLSPRNAIQAGVITAAAGESITIEPVDDDPLDNDEVEAVKIGVMDLRVGDNVFFIDAEGQPTREAGQLAKERGGLARVVLRVVDAALPLEELVKAYEEIEEPRAEGEGVLDPAIQGFHHARDQLLALLHG